MINNRGNNYVASILNNDEMLSDGDNEEMIRSHDMANGNSVPLRYNKGSGLRRNVDSHNVVANDLDVGPDDDYQSMHDDRDS